MSNSIALLTLDRGSVLYNPAQMPDEVVLKHADGELVQLTREGSSGRWDVERRDEYDINAFPDGQYGTPLAGLSTVADRQAFGFRVNGQAANPLDASLSEETPSTMEIECLNIGGLMVEGDRQLPFGVFTTDETYYRLYTAKSTGSGVSTDRVAILERRQGPRGDWEQLGEAMPTEVRALVKVLAEKADMETVSQPSSEKIENKINSGEGLFDAPISDDDQSRREQMAIQDQTSFSPDIPTPRPIDFPTSTN